MENSRDYSKGCIRFNEITCDCDVNIGECKGREMVYDNRLRYFRNEIDELHKIKSEMFREANINYAKYRKEIDSLKELLIEFQTIYENATSDEMSMFNDKVKEALK